jgi:hypothetical protein
LHFFRGLNAKTFKLTISANSVLKNTCTELIDKAINN